MRLRPLSAFRRPKVFGGFVDFFFFFFNEKSKIIAEQNIEIQKQQKIVSNSNHSFKINGYDNVQQTNTFENRENKN
jgi:hypothetical protein